MKIVNWFLAALAVLSFSLDSALAQTGEVKSGNSVIKVDPASKARIKFDSDIWEFGSIPRGSVVTHTFSFRNIGQDTLVITNVKPTCGCTTAPLSSNKIPPGGEANITATFNSEKFNGRVNKQIYVDSNDPINPYLKISFSAIINNPLQNIQPTPLEADFGSVKSGEEKQLSINIKNSEPKNAKLMIVEYPTVAKASLSTAEITSGSSADLILTLPPQAKAGAIQQSITLEAENIPSSRFTIPIKANIAL